jgi:ribosomal 30S subunit maturation factor RimM
VYLGKDAMTKDNTELGKVRDVAISSEGDVYFLVEKGENPDVRYYFTQQDVQQSDGQVVVRGARVFTNDVAKQSHFLCALYGVEVRDAANSRLGVIDNFVASPEGALVVIENPQGSALLGRYHDLDFTQLSKFAVLKQLPAQDSFDKYLKDVDKNKLLTTGITCDLNKVVAHESLLTRVRKRLQQSEEDRIIADRALID